MITFENFGVSIQAQRPRNSISWYGNEWFFLSQYVYKNILRRFTQNGPKLEITQCPQAMKQRNQEILIQLNIRHGGAAVKNLPAMPEWQVIWVWYLGWEDPLERQMATHFSILAWRIPWTEETGGLQSTGCTRVGDDWVTKHAQQWKTTDYSHTQQRGRTSQRKY